ncbi:MAG: Molybdopterin-guanine dinucleotide biosynthesis adapter protein [Pelotomaculum sp. PtaB.Bin013]|uniref:Molybdopterin-guanine dinucleotide biosynthesis protein B n=1 Tax=Pelotomaculum isophthalicicum JI TaxID=947010 RepID=A0A9X4H724_9FIRM|nr:molybdopterin-guanine dinucleotide biosynthesis protein B [Pelotomaculum isophthalicicum]MDF9409029.1 molybdopterin-guanine dinucleotide biosynthesis protein B [Pelotomaculum isophthalicicum JI]OPX91352.1 MAG: Molybdopterin-guanine dinucleotide biosynthesis adapter protein [Pelotomaculum sp. PtaB.Bin013]
MKVFSVFGYSKSGKTTTIEQIIPELKKRGYRVGSVKNIHNEGFFLDVVGSNTWRHRQAGSEMVVARGLKETDILLPRQLDMETILGYFNHDYVIVEGVSDTILPKILCAYEHEEIEGRLNDFIFVISGRISNHLSEYNGIPVINPLSDVKKLVDLIENKVADKMPFVNGLEHCGACGCNCRDFALRVLNGESIQKECVFIKNRVSVTIGQREILVDSLFESQLNSSIVGLLAQLDNFNPDDEIKISIGK